MAGLGSMVVWVFMLLWGHWKGLVATSCMCPLTYVRLSLGSGGLGEATLLSLGGALQGPRHVLCSQGAAMAPHGTVEGVKGLFLCLRKA